MKASRFLLLSLALCGFFIFQPAGNALSAESSGAMKLVGILTDQLDVTENQAAGGAGALFQTAKERLPESDFARVSSAIPGLSQLIGAAPAVSKGAGGFSDKIGGAGKGLEGLAKTAKNLDRLAGVQNQFSQLGLDPGMVSQFIPLILNFANSAGGETVMNLLKGVWQQ